jgi:gluconate 2-dehydrogenase gamma chain
VSDKGDGPEAGPQRPDEPDARADRDRSGAAPERGADEASAPGSSGGAGAAVAEHDGGGVTRRQALAGGGAAGAALFVVGGAVGYVARGPGKSSSSNEATTSTPAAESASESSSAQASLRSPTILPLRFFSAADATVIGAMADRIYPSDANGPGATELGVVNYIDGQLAGAWGTGERMYRQGPFAAATTSGHGWQYALTPADAYKVALDSLNAYTDAKYGGQTYDALSASQQDAILNALEQDKVPTFTAITGPDFFSLFLENVKEGVFADPSYGGNRGVGGWKLVRYPGDPMAYGDDQFKYVTDYGYYPSGSPRPLIVASTE